MQLEQIDLFEVLQPPQPSPQVIKWHFCQKAGLFVQWRGELKQWAFGEGVYARNRHNLKIKFLFSLKGL